MIQIINIPGGAGFNGYGQGLMRFNNPGQIAWGYGGNITGFAASMVYSPADRISVSVLINQNANAVPIGLVMLQTARQFLLLNTVSTTAASAPAFQCYPNPVTATGVAQFELPSAGNIELHLLNHIGEEIALLVSGYHAARSYPLPVSFQNLPDGMYFCRLKTNAGTRIQRWVLIW